MLSIPNNKEKSVSVVSSVVWSVLFFVRRSCFRLLCLAGVLALYVLLYRFLRKYPDLIRVVFIFPF
jgi:hypothetical protein